MRLTQLHSVVSMRGIRLEIRILGTLECGMQDRSFQTTLSSPPCPRKRTPSSLDFGITFSLNGVDLSFSCCVPAYCRLLGVSLDVFWLVSLQCSLHSRPHSPCLWLSCVPCARSHKPLVSSSLPELPRAVRTLSSHSSGASLPGALSSQVLPCPLSTQG